MSTNTGTVSGGMKGDVALSDDPDNIGDSLSIAMSVDPRSRAIWSIDVYAQTPQGAQYLGSARVLGPVDPQGFQYSKASRIIMSAYCPGASGWSITAFTESQFVAGTTQPEMASFHLKSRGCCGGGAEAGVWLVKPGAFNPQGQREFVDVPNTNLTGPLTPQNSNLWLISGQMVQALVAGASSFVQVFDQPAAPAAGDIPIWQQHLGQVAGGPPDPSFWDMPIGPNGRRIKSRLWVAMSTTPDLFTLDGAHFTSLHAEVSIA